MKHFRSFFALVAIAAIALVSAAPPARALDEIRKTTNGIYIAGTATQKVGFHGTAPTVQRAGSAQAAVTLTAATVTTATATDLATSEALANSLKTQLNAAIADNVNLAALVNELRASLVAKGLIKGAP